MKEGLSLFGIFYVAEGPLLHSSHTACVFKGNHFDKNNAVTGNSNGENEQLPISTALKFMNDIEPVHLMKTGLIAINLYDELI